MHSMGLLPDTYNCGLRMRRECRECSPHHWLQRKALVSDPGMHHARAVVHVGIANPRRRKNVPGIPGACTTCNSAYLVRGPCHGVIISFFMESLPANLYILGTGYQTHIKVITMPFDIPHHELNQISTRGPLVTSNGIIKASLQWFRQITPYGII